MYAAERLDEAGVNGSVTNTTEEASAETNATVAEEDSTSEKDVEEDKQEPLMEEDGQMRLFSEGNGEKGTEVKTAAQRIAMNITMEAAERLKKVGINVNIALEDEVRKVISINAEYSKYKRHKNKKDNTEIYQKFRIYTGRNNEITSEILKQKNQYNEFDYEVPIGIVNLNGNLYFYQNLDGSDFVVFGTLNYGELSDELEKELIKEIKDGTITSAEDIDKYVEEYENELRAYFEHNDGDRRGRDFTKDNGGIHTSDKSNPSSSDSEGFGITWYYRGNGDYEFLKSNDGTVYGWAEGNTITLTPEGINPNTPVHEYTHLWSKAVQKNNPALWERCKELAKT